MQLIFRNTCPLQNLQNIVADNRHHVTIRHGFKNVRWNNRQNKGAITVMQSLGTIFIRLIQMIVMPIVVSCLTVGIANIGDIRKLGRIGG